MGKSQLEAYLMARDILRKIRRKATVDGGDLPDTSGRHRLH